MSTLREQFDAQLAPLRARYEALQPREQIFVMAAGIAIGLALIWFLIWAPFAQARARQAAALDEARGVARTLALAEAQVSGRRPTVPVDRSMALDAAIEQASKNGTLPKPLSSLRRESETQVRVIAEGVPFDAAMRWIDELQTRYGVRVESADIERVDPPGTVNLRLALSRSP